MERRVDGLSGGERQRVALARALLASPRILLLDEPLAGLDRARRRRILPFLERLRHEFDVPLVYVTHQVDEIVELCDDVLALDEGRVAGRGPEALLDRA
jgi:molybdate transport system ATP-binding protein